MIMRIQINLESRRVHKLLLDGSPFPLELHIVHKRTDISSVDLALKQRHGLAVAGFFFEIAVCSIQTFPLTFNLYAISARGQRSPGPPDICPALDSKEGCQGGGHGVV